MSTIDSVSKAIALKHEIHTLVSKQDTDFDSAVLDLNTQISEMAEAFNPYVNVENVPGARTPKWYTLDIDFVTGETQAKSRAFEISSEGAFVMSSLQAYFKYTSENASDYYPDSNTLAFGSTPSGRYMPISTFPLIGDGVLQNIVQIAGSSPSDFTVNDFVSQGMYDIPEFSLNFELESTSQQWCDKWIPGGLVYTANNPLYFSGGCYVDRSERLIVTAAPDIRVPVGGTVRLVLHGYQILGEVTPEDTTRI
jgi:hypothetical protein